ncbi:MAG TPA: NADH:ubiquinone reductase (Na(+)-transporting) subunit D [Salinimicrobium sp.]|nr:NADH:ubiquinone reductase (Na(+)-transporting) subunit D [Salinimicrobium sp.]
MTQDIKNEKHNSELANVSEAEAKRDAMILFLSNSEEKEHFLSKRNRKLITDPLNDDNPITVQVLGICSALAITVQLEPSIVMAISVIVVVAFSNVIISFLRNLIPNRIRIIVQLVVVAGLVAIVDQILKAYAYDVSKQLSVFIGLIITNCIVMGRLEAFALGNKPWRSFLDGIGNGAGYGLILVIVAFFRELLGSGKLFGYEVLGHKGATLAESTGLYSFGYENNGMMLLSPMALIIVGVIIWVQRSKNRKLIEA